MTASYIHTTAICWWFNKYFLYIDMFLTHSVRFLPFDCWVLRSLEDSTSYMLLTSQFKVLEQTWNQRNRCFAFCNVDIVLRKNYTHYITFTSTCDGCLTVKARTRFFLGLGTRAQFISPKQPRAIQKNMFWNKNFAPLLQELVEKKLQKENEKIRFTFRI